MIISQINRTRHQKLLIRLKILFFHLVKQNKHKPEKNPPKVNRRVKPLANQNQMKVKMIVE